MKELELEDQGETLTDPTVIVLEHCLNVNLPKEYKGFLMRYNGGRPIKKRSFNFKDGNDGSSVNYFFGLPTSYGENKKRYYEDLIGAVATYVQKNRRIPWNFFPIASDSLGNLICISVKGPDYGKVYFWDHEMEADPEQGEDPDNCYDNVTLIADSFEEFLDGLYEYKLDEKS